LNTDTLSPDVVKKIAANADKNSSLEYLLNRKMSRQYMYGDDIPYSKICFSENFGNHNHISTKKIQENTHSHMHDYSLPPLTNSKQRINSSNCNESFAGGSLDGSDVDYFSIVSQAIDRKKSTANTGNITFA
jgi:hypothetical protein